MLDATIVIPNFNGEKFIMETIQLLSVGFPKIDIIVVDDVSTDNSVALLKSNGIKVLQRTVNGGFAASVNTGLQHLLSNGVGFSLVCNSDLVPSAEECANICKCFEDLYKDPSVGVIGFLERHDFKPQSRDSSDISGFLFWIRIDILKVVGYLDERFYMYGEETDFFRRVVAKGYKIVQSGIQVSHAAEKSGKSKIMNSWYAIRNCLFLEIKNDRPKEAFKKSVALLLVMFGLRGDKDDPSTRRVRRPGFVIGPLMLVGAILWNVYQVLKMSTKQENR